MVVRGLCVLCPLSRVCTVDSVVDRLCGKLFLSVGDAIIRLKQVATLHAGGIYRRDQFSLARPHYFHLWLLFVASYASWS